MTKKDNLISVAAIAFNHNDILESYITETITLLRTHYDHFELVILNNGSSDASSQTVIRLQSQFENIRLINLSRVYDDQIVYTAALDNCIGDVIVLMDINFDPPSMIPQLVEACLSGHDIVIAELRNRKDEPFLIRLTSKAFYTVSKFFTGYAICSNYSNFCAFSRRVVNSINRIKDRNRYIKYLLFEVGYNRVMIPYNKINRCGLAKKRKFFSSLNFALQVIISNSDRLIRLASLSALLVSLLNFLYGIYVFFIFIFKEDVAEGWPSSQLVNAAMYCILFFILAVFGEYIARILQETKKSDLYYIAEENNSSVAPHNIDKKNIV